MPLAAPICCCLLWSAALLGQAPTMPAPFPGEAAARPMFAPPPISSAGPGDAAQPAGHQRLLEPAWQETPSGQAATTTRGINSAGTLAPGGTAVAGPASGASRIPLGPRPRREGELPGEGGLPGDTAQPLRPPQNSFSLTGMCSSLAVVVGLFLLVSWLWKRGQPAGSLALPDDVVEVLGRAVLPQRQHLHLVRCGSKLLLVHLSAAGARTLTEIVDPLEVDRLAGLCRAAQPGSATATFQQMMQNLGREPPEPAQTAAGSPSVGARLARVLGSSPRPSSPAAEEDDDV